MSWKFCSVLLDKYFEKKRPPDNKCGKGTTPSNRAGNIEHCSTTLFKHRSSAIQLGKNCQSIIQLSEASWRFMQLAVWRLGGQFPPMIPKIGYSSWADLRTLLEAQQKTESKSEAPLTTFPDQ
ncbi:hypothetical protein T10_12537 [Trichinella papuae]|uniref:Uncharacterized protein n=1 Tax=Trichinella papuae TaxID=268474 RepID=A0A0V1N4A4_9BILA|nr:hypothetical protein T10_12537 [Trichinella papuae]